jgi:hypothetical protein
MNLTTSSSVSSKTPESHFSFIVQASARLKSVCFLMRALSRHQPTRPDKQTRVLNQPIMAQEVGGLRRGGVVAAKPLSGANAGDATNST